MKILIITPFRKGKIIESIVSNIENYEVINTAPLQLCSVLENEGHEVEFLALQNVFRSYNENLHNCLLKKIIGRFEFDILIFHTDYYMNNSNTAAIFSMQIISKIVKNMMKRIKIIYCGKLTEMLEEELLRLVPEIDIAIRGEAEPIIGEILDELSIQQYLVKFTSCIINIDNEIKSYDGVSYIYDYNKLPIINYGFLENTINIINKYVRKVDILPISIRTSYGCPFSCKFCKNTKNWNRYRTKSKETIDAEIKNINKACDGKLKIVFLSDEIFTYSLKHVVDICEILRMNNIIVNGLFSHVNCISEEILYEVKNITRSIILGAESFDKKILETANKGIIFESLLEKLSLIRKHNLAVGLEWIIGLPGSTIETHLNDFNQIYMLIVNKKADFIEPYIFTPHPNTEFYNESKKYDMIINKNYSEMLEEGGIPQFFYKGKLTSQQIYALYFICKMVISEAEKAREHIIYEMEFGKVNLCDFEKIIGEFVL